MKIKILRGVCLGGGVDAHPGDEVDVGEFQGAGLIAKGKAVAVAEKPGKGKGKGKGKAKDADADAGEGAGEGGSDED